MAHHHVYAALSDADGNFIGWFPRLSRASKWAFFERLVGTDWHHGGYYVEYKDDPNGVSWVRVRRARDGQDDPISEWEPINELPESPLHQQFDLGDETDRMVLADLLEDEGRDEEGALLRNPPPTSKPTASARWVPVRWEGGRIVSNESPAEWADYGTTWVDR